MMERWDVLDENGKATGKTVVRGTVRLTSGEYHLVVHIWVLTPDGRLMVQRRADDKELMPGEWAAIGGAAIAGEDSLGAAKRELFEEMGIRAGTGEISLIRRFVRKNSFVDVWLAQVNTSLDQLRLQKSEVSDAQWIAPEELAGWIRDGRFHNYGSDYFEVVFSAIKLASAGVRG